jgi:hypothetical protein
MDYRAGRSPRRYGLGQAIAVIACQVAAVTIGRTLTDTYAGIAPASAPAFIAAQIIGGALGTLLAVAVYPVRRGRVRVQQPAQLAGRPGKASA